MKYAVIRTGGKQYKINEGDIIDVERLEHESGNAITFSEVLMVTEDSEVRLGTPLLSDVSVRGTVVDDIRGEKIRVAKFKAKARYRRVTGHRQALTRVKIESIVLPGTAKKVSKETSVVKAEKKPVRRTVKKT
jgi:large subunit ribosomal protein L21